MTNMESLLPQRYPFLFVDQLLSADKDTITGTKIYDTSFLYFQEYVPGKKIVPGSILIESIVQCGGAGLNRINLANRSLWGLASLETVRFFDFVEANTQVTMVVKNLKFTDKLVKQRGTASCEGKSILEATWLCLRL